MSLSLFGIDYTRNAARRTTIDDKDPDALLFHGTTASKLDGILRDGLIPVPAMDGRFVYASADRDCALSYAQTRADEELTRARILRQVAGKFPDSMRPDLPEHAACRELGMVLVTIQVRPNHGWVRTSRRWYAEYVSARPIPVKRLTVEHVATRAVRAGKIITLDGDNG